MFVLLGNAVGLSVSNTVDPAVSAALRFWSWVYVAATMIASYYFGGLVASSSNERVDSGSDILHSIVCWGLASVSGAVIAASFSGTMLSILTGVGPNSGNWLAICTVGVGFGSCIVGGMSGKGVARAIPAEEHEETKEYRAS